jgi:hypothetical protein
VVEDAVDGDEESGDEAAADEEENDEAEHSHAVVDLSGFVGQEVAKDVAAVERGERDKVEDEEQQVDEDDEVEKERDGEERGKAFCGDSRHVLRDGDSCDDAGIAGGQDVFDDNQENESDAGREQVAGGAGEGDEDVIAAVVLEVASGDGSGLRPADEEAAVDQRDEREEDGADGVEVLDWVEGDTAKHHRGGVAEAHGGPGVRALVHAEGEDQNNYFEEDNDNVQRHTDSSLLNFA